MSTTEDVTSTTQSNNTSRRYSKSTPTENSNDINGEHSASNINSVAAVVNVSFAKDEKKHLTPYAKLLYESQNDPRFKAEEQAGRRIGFYRIQKDIGVGNFSRVKLGLHLLAKGINNF